MPEILVKDKLVTVEEIGAAYDNLNTNKKSVQTAVTDPTASGTAVSFIDSISQNAQGVITPTKKTVAEATASASGLMSSTDKGKLDGIEAGAQVNTVNSVNNKTGAVVLEAEDVSAIKDDYSYDAAAYPYTGQELILLHNVTTGENTVTDVASFLSSAGGGSGTNQGALVHYTKTISVSAGSTAQTFQDDNITDNMVVLQAVITNPAAQGDDWNFTTSNGSVVLNGAVTEATTVTLYFGVSLSAAPSIQVNLASTAADNILKSNPTPGVMGTLGRGNGGTGVSASDAADLLSKLGAVNKAGVMKTKSISATTSANSNINLELSYSSAIPYVFKGETTSGTQVYGIIGKYNTADTGNWGCKIISEYLSNGQLQPLPNTAVTGTVYYMNLA